MKEENLDEKVPVRAYTKADLAMLYNPGVCITTALQLLRRWIAPRRSASSSRSIGRKETNGTVTGVSDMG